MNATPPATPTVSVVIPLYNKRSTVERTLRSVFAQTFPDFEVIIVDDGSSDDGVDFIQERFVDPRIVINRQANAGPGAARNRGADLSRGRLLTFLDADDTWEPGFLGQAVASLEAHPECDAFTAAFYLEPSGIDRWAELRADGLVEGPWRLTPVVPRRELGRCLGAFHACTAVYRREVVTVLGGFYGKDHCTLGEDVYFWIQVLLRYRIYRHTTPLAHYNMDDSQLGISARPRFLPLEPVLTDPEPVRAICPPDLRPVLELWLAQHALRAAFMQLDRGDTAKARWLVGHYPLMRAWGAQALKLRIRLMAPSLWSGLRAMLRRR